MKDPLQASRQAPFKAHIKQPLADRQLAARIETELRRRLAGGVTQAGPSSGPCTLRGCGCGQQGSGDGKTQHRRALSSAVRAALTSALPGGRR